MSLEQELSGVISHVDSAPEVDTTDETGATPAVADNADALTSDDASDGATSERPVENVRRELLRKQDESERRIREEISRMANLVQATLGALQTGKKSEQPSPSDYTVAQLESMRGQVPEGQLAAFDQLIAEKRIAETVDAKIAQRLQADKYEHERNQMNRRAMERYPQLTDKMSPLYQEVNRRLVALDKDTIRYNSRIVLNLTEDVAGELGIAPRLINKSRQVPKTDSLASRKPADMSPADSVISSDTEFAELARKFGQGKVKFDEAALKRIRERGVEYKQDPRFSGTKE